MIASIIASIKDIKKLIKQLVNVVCIIDKKFFCDIRLNKDFTTELGYGIRYSLSTINAVINHIQISSNIDIDVVNTFLRLICLIIEVIIR